MNKLSSVFMDKTPVILSNFHVHLNNSLYRTKIWTASKGELHAVLWIPLFGPQLCWPPFQEAYRVPGIYRLHLSPSIPLPAGSTWGTVSSGEQRVVCPKWPTALPTFLRRSAEPKNRSDGAQPAEVGSMLFLNSIMGPTALPVSATTLASIRNIQPMPPPPKKPNQPKQTKN